ncbi:MAG TPA: hypothetical protein ENK43_02330 [Planctomycetes bacterium]|nr:hypothetical protein [Planctomycetota bacterium]
MVDQSRASAALFLAFLCLLVRGVSAQAEPGYVVGWMEFRDDRSEALGLGRVLDFTPSVTRFRVDLDRPETWRIDALDMLIVGSFCERHPNWSRFVGEKKSAVLAMVKSGGVLVRMDRYRWADRKKGKGVYQPDLLPPGWWVKRSGKDPAQLFGNDQAHPVWKHITARAARGGWYRIPLNEVGKQHSYFLDAFEDWGPPLRMNSGPARRLRGGRAAGLHGRFGKGWILLFQLCLDKYVDLQGRPTRAISKRFFGNLLRWGSQSVGPRERKAPLVPKRPDPKPRPVDPPVVVPPTPKPVFVRRPGRLWLIALREGSDVVLKGLATSLRDEFRVREPHHVLLLSVGARSVDLEAARELIRRAGRQPLEFGDFRGRPGRDVPFAGGRLLLLAQVRDRDASRRWLVEQSREPDERRILVLERAADLVVLEGLSPDRFEFVAAAGDPGSRPRTARRGRVPIIGARVEEGAPWLLVLDSDKATTTARELLSPRTVPPRAVTPPPTPVRPDLPAHPLVRGSLDKVIQALSGRDR